MLGDEEVASIMNHPGAGPNSQNILRCMQGSTALVTLVDPSSSQLWVANLGDCRAGKSFVRCSQASISDFFSCLIRQSLSRRTRVGLYCLGALMTSTTEATHRNDVESGTSTLGKGSVCLMTAFWAFLLPLEVRPCCACLPVWVLGQSLRLGSDSDCLFFFCASVGRYMDETARRLLSPRTNEDEGVLVRRDIWHAHRQAQDSSLRVQCPRRLPPLFAQATPHIWIWSLLELG